METIDMGGELSEFFGIKDVIEAYKENEMLLGYIVDESKDVDEFYVCGTIEARDHCKAQSDRFIRRQEKKLEKSVQKKPRPWKSLGSEMEIKELVPVNTRPLIEIEIKTPFPTAYQPQRFDVRDANDARDGYIELTPYRQRFNIVFSRRIDTGSQASPAKQNNYAQTELRFPANVWTQATADAPAADTTGGGDTKDTKAGGDDGGDGEEEKTLMMMKKKNQKNRKMMLP